MSKVSDNHGIWHDVSRQEFECGLDDRLRLASLRIGGTYALRLTTEPPEAREFARQTLVSITAASLVSRSTPYSTVHACVERNGERFGEDFELNVQLDGSASAEPDEHGYFLDKRFPPNLGSWTQEDNLVLQGLPDEQPSATDK